MNVKFILFKFRCYKYSYNLLAWKRWNSKRHISLSIAQMCDHPIMNFSYKLIFYHDFYRNDISSDFVNNYWVLRPVLKLDIRKIHFIFLLGYLLLVYAMSSNIPDVCSVLLLYRDYSRIKSRFWNRNFQNSWN